MKHLIDPGQFVLFWIALLMNQFWIEYFSVRYQSISFQLYLQIYFIKSTLNQYTMIQQVVFKF